MKQYKIYTVMVALLLASFSTFAGSVDTQRAKTLGEKFVEANFKHYTQLEWVYTAVTNQGHPSCHVFNGTSGGFVIVSACDLTSPILGYSETGTFSTDNIPDGMAYFLDGYGQSVDYAEAILQKPDFAIAQEWENLERCGVTQLTKTDVVAPLIATHWDQECFYNEYCPEHPDGWCGHAKTGCVATAMGQVMKFWNYPEHGIGSHSYNCYYYGQLSADFGSTTYHWDQMPETLDDYNDAVATLLYHCGVSVDMGYGIPPGGSGSSEVNMASALRNYFGYGFNHCLDRSDYTYDEWTAIMRDALNAGLPIPYAGADAEQMVGHSFVCDGYDANGLFHFNWGWSGELDGYFAITNLKTYNFNWNTSQQMIPDVRPLPVYNGTPKSPEDFSIEPLSNTSYICSISWRNPSRTLNNSVLTLVDQVVVTRDGEVVYTANNVAPGAVMEITDEVPCYGLYDYQVYAVNGNCHGEASSQNAVRFGPSCVWSVDCSTNSISWYGAKINVINNMGQVVGSATSTTSSQTVSLEVPLGRVSFAWSQGNSSMSSVSFTIKNAENQVAYSYSGATADLPDGVFWSTNNDCGSGVSCNAPESLYAEGLEDGVALNWTASADDMDYNVYRDGVVIKTVMDATSFIDDAVSQGGHCYYVTAFCEGGESEPTNEACASVGDDCQPATDLWYEMTSNNKVKLTWETPQPHDGLSGFYIYRTKEADMNWQKIKTLSASAISYTDNTSMEDETSYLYKVVAYYQAIDCYSAPARSKYNEFEYFLRVYWSVDGLDETEGKCIEVYPNPGINSLSIRITLESATLQFFDIVGHKVIEMPLTKTTTTLNTEKWPVGVYFWKVYSDNCEAETGKWIKK